MGGVGGGVICESCDPISQFCQILSAEMLSSVSAACILPVPLTASRVKVMTEPQSVKNNDLLETKTTLKYVILSRPKQE